MTIPRYSDVLIPEDVELPELKLEDIEENRARIFLRLTNLKGDWYVMDNQGDLFGCAVFAPELSIEYVSLDNMVRLGLKRDTHFTGGANAMEFMSEHDHYDPSADDAEAFYFGS